MAAFWDQSAAFIPGVGPGREAKLAALGVRTVRDVLYYFPMRYEDVSYHEASSFAHGSSVTVPAVVDGAVSIRYKGSRSRSEVPIIVYGLRMKAVFFNQPYVRNQLRPGQSLRLHGRYDEKWRSIAVAAFEPMERVQDIRGLRPVYRVTRDFSTATMRRLLESALRVFGAQIEDELPLSLRERLRLLPLAEALRAIHFPKDAEDLRQARRRLVFEEFLRFQLRVQGFRHLRQRETRASLDVGRLRVAASTIVDRLPFALTAGQEAALADVLADVAAPHASHRLLQGDVGSGKTAVILAAAAALAAVGWQTAIMAPTTLLARQHFETAQSLLFASGIHVTYVGGGQTTAERDRALEEIRCGSASVAVGTHALAADVVCFARLRLVVVDEQHRFGVVSRRLLREKASQTDLLQLSATPIPRTLALTLYGDTAISSLRERPPGRRDIVTHAVLPEEESKVIRFLRRELAKGRQIYLVAPRIEPGEADDGNTETALQLFARMEEELAGWSVGLIHGDMREVDREEVMAQFVSGVIQALVATTIIEVGVNVPNASVMVIFGADRFGLSTLHQLRGRVGRAEHPSACFLIARPTTETAKARLRALQETQDGFELADRDLALRGPGEAFGARQSGLPTFRIGDLAADFKVMETARQIASEWLRSQDFWLLPAYKPLRESVLADVDEGNWDS